MAEFPNSVIYEISRWLIYNFATGKTDISGEDWGNIFAEAINGEHLSSPLGLADVIYGKQAWSLKSVKQAKPHTANTIRVISGRNSPDYSYGINDPRADIQKTGEAVLNIWNERVKIALDQFDYLRTGVLVRNVKTLQFTLMEMPTQQYIPAEYVWRENKRGNFEGYTKVSDMHKFTWQPHGSQFTVKHIVPASAVRFSVKKPPILDFEETLQQIGFEEGWVTIKGSK